MIDTEEKNWIGLNQDIRFEISEQWSVFLQYTYYGSPAGNKNFDELKLLANYYF